MRTIEELRVSDTLTPLEQERLMEHAKTVLKKTLDRGVTKEQIRSNIEQGNFPQVVKGVYLSALDRLNGNMTPLFIALAVGAGIYFTMKG